MPDERNDKQRFNAVFRILRKLGFFAKQDFWCCMTCGVHAVPDDAKKWVFYHGQDVDAFRLGYNGPKTKFLHKPIAIAFGTTLVEGREIVGVFESEGFEVEWDGMMEHRIMVQPRPEQRFPCQR